jgi:biopolymer transport protein ExbD
VRVKAHKDATVELDMTPMIDMTFQLIAFFMILINFDASEQDERIQLPASTLAKPPEAPLETPITLQLTRQGEVIAGGQLYAEAAALRPLLNNERNVLRLKNRSEKDATIIIRADRNTPTGKVQDLIKLCQEMGFEKFTLRAKENVGY